MSAPVKERLIDAGLTLFIFCPLVVFYWSSTWNLLDLYMLPGNQKLSVSISAGISYVILLASFFTQDFLNRHVTMKNVLLYSVVSRIYTYILTLTLVLNWRGVWTLLDIYTGETFLSGGINAATGVIGLVLLRSYRNALSSPGSWNLDLERDNRFTIMSRFRTQKGTLLHVFDVVFGVVVVSTLVVLVWRGKWLVLQHIIFPDSLLWQGITASIIGNVLVGSLIVLQYPARRLATRLHTTSHRLHVLFEDVFVFVVCLSAVMYWMGLWQLLTVLFEERSPYVSQWMLHIIGAGGMMALRVFSSLQFSGYFIDGEFPQGLGIVQTPTYYQAFIKSPLPNKETLRDAIHKVTDDSTVYVETSRNGQI